MLLFPLSALQVNVNMKIRFVSFILLPFLSLLVMVECNIFPSTGISPRVRYAHVLKVDVVEFQ